MNRNGLISPQFTIQNKSLLIHLRILILHSGPGVTPYQFVCDTRPFALSCSDIVLYLIRHLLAAPELLVYVLVNIFKHVPVHHAALAHLLGHCDPAELRIGRHQRDR